MPLKDEQVPELHGKMPNVTSETVENYCLRRFYCYCWLLLLLATCYCAPKAAADNKLPYLLLQAPADSKTPCH